MQALGAERIEALCDAFCDFLAEKYAPCGLVPRQRFSPGYGDLPLALQPRLLEAADAARRLGVYETDTHLMNPQKSVTALIGVADEPQMARIRGCAHCSMRDTCMIRKAGKTCEL